MTQRELDQRLFRACTAQPVRLDEAEALLRQGARPLGAFTLSGYWDEMYLDDEDYADNVYTAVLGCLLSGKETAPAVYDVTALFLRYGMDLEKPAIGYDGGEHPHPLACLALPSGGAGLKTLSLLLENGLSAEQAAVCWKRAVSDLPLLCEGADDPFVGELLCDCAGKLLLTASFPHVLQADAALRETIWYGRNDFDPARFRDWEAFSVEPGPVPCESAALALLTIREKDTDTPVWRFRIGVKPEE